ncbi:DUF3017 family protein [Tamaricihabitans halophyticus]|uniref:DUF3017 family protein n=1 Tax=Tamaricihabitans halophyticus TaxID=1262583 RepID=A0A4R2QKJ8_9PSEU|nr:DUF3017 domain-containing protein [Tamaricihabitans halophyticus]TCP49379.1 DUF3017 family protein [Tamaricihabitans halophyticus]
MSWRERGVRGSAPYAPFLVVVGLVAIGLVQIALYYWRQGTGMVGIALLVAAVIRLALSDDRVWLLAIRSRPVDALTYAGLGLLIVVVALTIEGGPLG